MDLRQQAEREVQARTRAATDLIKVIHDLAEPPMHEFESSKRLASFLEAEGFRIEWPWRQLPTAFRAEWGAGRPTVGILGEYDALPDCGAKPGEWGHGCGHDLLGVGSAVGALAAKAVLESRKARGRIVFYGCPAEETIVGKVYMARDGAFRDLDACLTWHPGTTTRVHRAGGAAVDSLVYEFFGRTSHAAGSPEKGRSALDAAVLFDVAINYLREHVPENVRIHGVVREGGDAPNVITPYARVWYFIRGTDRAQVEEVRRRVRACARGATIATETRFKETRLTGVYDRLPNDAIHDVLGEHLRHFGPPRATRRDRLAARKLGFTKGFATEPGEDIRDQTRASTDDSNVSWLAPMASFFMACHAIGTPLHHRCVTEQNLLPYAVGGAMQAAKIFAATAADLCLDRKKMQKVKAEFRRRTKHFIYDPIVPKRQKAPVEAP